MENGKFIGKTTRVFPRLRCVAIELSGRKGVVLEEGMTLNFIREGRGIGLMDYHNSVRYITSIEINHQRRRRVTHQDGICAVLIGGLPEDLPPSGCDVVLINDQAPEA